MGFCQCQKNVEVVTTPTQDQHQKAMNHGKDLPEQKDRETNKTVPGNGPTDDTDIMQLPATSSSSDGDGDDGKGHDSSNKEKKYSNEAWEDLAITLPLDVDVQPISSEHSTIVPSNANENTDRAVAAPAEDSSSVTTTTAVDNIWDACEKGMLEEVKEFLAKDSSLIMKSSPPDHNDDSGSECSPRAQQMNAARTPLYYASLGGHVEVMKYLMDQGARDDDGGCYLAASSAEGRRLLLFREQNNSTDISQATVERNEKDQKTDDGVDGTGDGAGDGDGDGMLSATLRLVSCCGPLPLQD